ncbi:hypothetical protein POTOM_011406 [Populus tomentosa]|uniref:RRM domain-containing protein n=1 Tax=Populus tomentosa TaxID=118781 RepID=A0A8X8D899_POPTO|nr:hypothetical protein POTOM_011406 [Populus tomentosa]
MSHFGRSGPPDIADTYSLLVLNITFRTTADDLFPLFDKYGKVVDIFIPRDRRTGESRGFAFVRYKYADEAQKAVERLDGRVVDGREITVQFAKYGPKAERIHKGRIVETPSKSRHRSRSRSPRRRYLFLRLFFFFLVTRMSLSINLYAFRSQEPLAIDRCKFCGGEGFCWWYRDDSRDRDSRKRSRSRSRDRDRSDRDRYRAKDKDYRRRSRSRSASPDYSRGRGRSRYDDERRSSSRSRDSLSPRRSLEPRRSYSPRKNSPVKGESPDRRSRDGGSPIPRSASPRGRPAASRSPSPRNSDVDVSCSPHAPIY